MLIKCIAILNTLAIIEESVLNTTLRRDSLMWIRWIICKLYLPTLKFILILMAASIRNNILAEYCFSSIQSLAYNLRCWLPVVYTVTHH